MPPSLSRLHELFIIVKGQLRWRVQAPGEHFRSAPTGQNVNVDGEILSCGQIRDQMLPAGIDVLKSGKFRLRYTLNGRRCHVLYDDLIEASNDNALLKAPSSR